MPDENGETRRQRNTKFGHPSPDYDAPDAVAHVWEWFWDLSARRKSGPEALTYAEIGEWQRLTGTAIRPEEVEMLMKMDDAFLADVREEQRMHMVRARDKATGGRA